MLLHLLIQRRHFDLHRTTIKGDAIVLFNSFHSADLVLENDLCGSYGSSNSRMVDAVSHDRSELAKQFLDILVCDTKVKIADVNFELMLGSLGLLLLCHRLTSRLLFGIKTRLLLLISDLLERSGAELHPPHRLLYLRHLQFEALLETLVAESLKLSLALRRHYSHRLVEVSSHCHPGGRASFLDKASLVELSSHYQRIPIPTSEAHHRRVSAPLTSLMEKSPALLIVKLRGLLPSGEFAVEFDISALDNLIQRLIHFKVSRKFSKPFNL